MRTPQVPSRPGNPGRRASPTKATAASPYARSAGQNSSSTNVRPLPRRLGARASLPREPGELLHLALEPNELQRDDQHVGENGREDDEIGGGHVLLGRGHASSSRNSRRRESRRF